MSVVGNQVNEIVALHLVRSYCHATAHVYGCEIWPLNSVNMKLILYGIMGFDVCLTAAGEKVVKPLQFYCRTLQISYLIGERQLLFYRRLFCSDNIVLRTLAGLVRFEMLGIAAKYDIKSIYFSTTTFKNAVWSSFVNVKF